ncbi:MAG TPA: DUF2304 domain-containing protein [Conexibacter sp.]|nr:DUF2304 domain-containing protein [Conexibacter sp.]
MDRIQLVSTTAAVLLLLVVLELVRRRRLLERYALLWLFAATVVLVLALWRGALVKLANLFGIVEPPNALFFIALAFILLLLLHFSAALSRLSDQSKVLAQRVALLDTRLQALQRSTTGERDGEHVGTAIGELERTRS